MKWFSGFFRVFSVDDVCSVTVNWCPKTDVVDPLLTENNGGKDIDIFKAPCKVIM